MRAPPELDEAVGRFLAQPLGPPTAVSDLTARARKQRTRRRSGIAIAVSILGIVSVAGFLRVSSTRHDNLAITARSNTSLGTHAATTVQLGTPRPHLGPLPFDIAYGDGSVWVRRDSTVERRDPSGRLLARFAVPGEGDARSLLYIDGSLWIANNRQLLRLDPRSGNLTALPIAAQTLAMFHDMIWVGASGEYFVVDPRTNHVTKRLPNLSTVDTTRDALWTIYPVTGLYRVDPRTLNATETHIKASYILSTTPDTIWLLSGYSTITQIDARHTTPVGAPLQAQGLVRQAEPTGEILLVGALSNAGATLAAYDIHTHHQLARTSPLPDQGWTRIIITPKNVWVLGEQRLYRIPITITTNR